MGGKKLVFNVFQKTAQETRCSIPERDESTHSTNFTYVQACDIHNDPSAVQCFYEISLHSTEFVK